MKFANNPAQESYSLFELLSTILKLLIWPGLLLLIASSCQSIPECPPGYEGEQCGQEITPAAIYVKEIRVVDCPLPTLASAGGGAAIVGVMNLEVEISYFVRSDEPTTILNTSTQLATGFEQVNTFGYQNFLEICTIAEPEIPHRIALYERHSNQAMRSLVSSIDFYPYRNSYGFPDTLFLTNEQVNFELVLEYEWNPGKPAKQVALLDQ